MANRVEAATSGRASCRVCRKKIAKGELRFGLEEENPFSSSGGTSMKWHHLECGASTRPAELRAALAGFDGEVPDLEAAFKKGAKATREFPYAEPAPSGRSTCMECSEKIPKGALRVAVEREVDTGMFTAMRPGYLHPQCTLAHLGQDVVDEVLDNSLELADDQREALEAALG